MKLLHYYCFILQSKSLYPAVPFICLICIPLLFILHLFSFLFFVVAHDLAFTVLSSSVFHQSLLDNLCLLLCLRTSQKDLSSLNAAQIPQTDCKRLVSVYEGKFILRDVDLVRRGTCRWHIGRSLENQPHGPQDPPSELLVGGRGQRVNRGQAFVAAGSDWMVGCSLLWRERKKKRESH